MTGPTQYRTLKNSCTAEFKDRGSKFLAVGYPVASVAAVKEKVQLLKKEHPKAAHHCFAYRIGTDGNEYRASDDGEPSGSAGRPILGQIDSAGLTNVLVVVVRYFGGTLLGVPGLINAYKTATADALAIAETAEKWIEKKVVIQFDYPAMGEVLHILRAAEANVTEQELLLFCTIKAGIPIVHYEQCIRKLKEIQGLECRNE